VEDWRSGLVSITAYVWQIGQLFVVACPGEPYAWLQTEVRRRVTGQGVRAGAATSPETRVSERASEWVSEW
jgi:hypothetical protein